jgi:hypothetical protein
MLNIIKRIKEPSTQAGIASLVSVAAIVGVPQNTAEAIAQAVTGLCSLAAIFLPESK